MSETEFNTAPPAIENPQQRAKLLAELHNAQNQHGWLSPETIQGVAHRLKLSPGQVKATASFYTMFSFAPRGTYHIQVCEGLSCYLVGGADPIVDHIAERLHIKPGEITPDHKFSLEVVQCIASCGTAPALRVNNELYENMTHAEIDALLLNLSRK